MSLDVVTGELVPIGGQLTPEQASARAEWVREMRRAVLAEGTDYAVLPGTDKPTLLKPGAEVLLLAAGFGFAMTKIDDSDARAHHGVTYKASVHRADGFVVAECEGFAGYDESRFFTSAEDAARRERAYAEHDRRPAKPERMVEYRAPWNTLVKMAQKRALVGATLNACAASGLFIADLDDVGGGGDREPTTAAASGEAAAVVARADALPEAQRTVFREWRESRNYPWPPTSAAVTSTALREVERLEALAADGAGTSQSPSAQSTPAATGSAAPEATTTSPAAAPTSPARGESPGADDPDSSSRDVGALVSDEQIVAMRALFDALPAFGANAPGGLDPLERRLAYMAEVLGRDDVVDVEELTGAEAERVLEVLRLEGHS
jgi:hypothetical protein